MKKYLERPTKKLGGWCGVWGYTPLYVPNGSLCSYVSVLSAKNDFYFLIVHKSEIAAST